MNLSNLEARQLPSEDWIEKELQHVKLGDKRLNKRFLKTSKLIESKASGSINQSCRSWKEVIECSPSTLYQWLKRRHLHVK